MKSLHGHKFQLVKRFPILRVRLNDDAQAKFIVDVTLRQACEGRFSIMPAEVRSRPQCC